MFEKLMKLIKMHRVIHVFVIFTYERTENATNM